jgi:ribosome-associated heat shock protein Hsp15
MPGVRLDKWLWAARFYKTRRLATEAATGGKIHVNGVRAKPGRSLKTGDELTIKRHAMQMVVIVTALSERRGPADVARQLYQETEHSRRRRSEAAAQQRLIRQQAPHPPGRPDKKARRDIARFRGR